ncbi:MAG TPA: hypothetical protein PK303_02550 [bacterium]|nr:hypothetical protein [bacterium]HOL35002.1 hypothetical protein [bacterium]HPP07987.1 hypothetical protein [bacterium]
MFNGYERRITLLIILLLFIPVLLTCGCLADSKEKDNIWGETKRAPREHFQPASSQISFDLSKSLLENPGLQPSDSPEKLPKSWWGNLRVWKDVYKAPDIYSKMVRIQQDEKITFQGNPSVKVSIAPSEEEVYLELYQEIRMKDKNLKGKKIRLSFYAYREKPPTGKEFFVTGIMFNKEGQVIGTTVDIRPSITPGKWIFFSQEGMVKPETELFKFSMRFISGGNDTIWLSGFLLEEIQ